MSTPHDAHFAWGTIEASLCQLAQAKLTNRHRRDTGQMASIGAELATIREMYLRLHVAAYPLCSCGPRCWQAATERYYAEEVAQ